MIDLLGCKAQDEGQQIGRERKNPKERHTRHIETNRIRHPHEKDDGTPGEQEPQCDPRDGRLLAFHQQQGLYALQFDETGRPVGEPELLVDQPGSQGYADFSPDGKWLAYSSGESAGWKVYVKALDGKGATVLVSTSVGYYPHWSPVESKLFYTTSFGIRKMMSVDYTTENGVFKPSLPVEVCCA